MPAPWCVDATAFDLAESLSAETKSVREGTGRVGRVHLFMAAPGAFALYLGQRRTVIGPLTLYEGARGGSYEPALSLPVGN